MRTTRVLVANHPRLIRDLVMAMICEHTDIAVVGELQDEAEILQAIEQKQPDFLIIALEDPQHRPALCDLVLERHPHLKVLAISPRGEQNIFYWASLLIHEKPIEVSEQNCVDVLRGVRLSSGVNS